MNTWWDNNKDILSQPEENDQTSTWQGLAQWRYAHPHDSIAWPEYKV